MYDVTKCAAQNAIIDLGMAFRAFFEKRGKLRALVPLPIRALALHNAGQGINVSK